MHVLFIQTYLWGDDMISILTIIVGILEFTLFTWILKFIFISLVAHDITMLVCFAMIIFIMWLFKKLENLKGDN